MRETFPVDGVSHDFLRSRRFQFSFVVLVEGCTVVCTNALFYLSCFVEERKVKTGLLSDSAELL